MASREECDRGMSLGHQAIDDINALIRGTIEKLLDWETESPSAGKVNRLQVIQRELGVGLQDIATSIAVTATNLKARA